MIGNSPEVSNFDQLSLNINRRFLLILFFICFILFFEIEGWHVNAKAREAIDHMVSFPSDGEEISQPEIEPPTSSLRFGYLSCII